MNASTTLKAATIAFTALFSTGLFRYGVLIGSSLDRWEYKQIIGVEVVWVGIPTSIAVFLASLYFLSREGKRIDRQLVRLQRYAGLSLDQHTAIEVVRSLLKEEEQR